jgi:lysozyme
MTRLIADLSNWQQPVSVGAVARSCDGLYHKLTEGTTFVDRYAAERHHEAAKLRLPFGVYHFAHPEHEQPVAEADCFLHGIHALNPAGLAPSDLSPVLDLESGNPATSTKWAKEFTSAIYRALGVWPMFYSYPDYIARMRLGRPIGNGLWLASYSKNDGADHPYMIPQPWRHTRLHQFTSAGAINGVPMRVDLSHGARIPFAHPLRAGAHGFTV